MREVGKLAYEPSSNVLEWRGPKAHATGRRFGEVERTMGWMVVRTCQPRAVLTGKSEVEGGGIEGTVDTPGSEPMHLVLRLGGMSPCGQ